MILKRISALILFLIMCVWAMSFSGCEPSTTTIVYKCPRGQVLVTEDKGTHLERDVCYTPGVSYTDFRPITTTPKESF